MALGRHREAQQVFNPPTMGSTVRIPRSLMHTGKWPTAIDLFCGAGGLTLGLRQACFRVVAAVEKDPLACETYRLNFGRRIHVEPKDIREVEGSTLLKAAGLARGELDLLAGCPPCQGFSRMRTKNRGESSSDDRNDLVHQFTRLVAEIVPRAAMMENVPGLAHDERLQDTVAKLNHLGYEVAWKVLNAAHFGVPQRRRRLMLVATRGAQFQFAEREPTQPTVRDAISGLPPAGTSGDQLHDHGERRSSAVEALITAIPRDGGSRSSLGAGFQLACHQNFDGFHDVYGRMAWDSPAPTITGGCVNPSKGRFLHPEEDRTITLREAALLQGFPRHYRFSLSGGKFRAAQMIGNAFPPGLVRRHAAELRQLLRRTEANV